MARTHTHTHAQSSPFVYPPLRHTPVRPYITRSVSFGVQDEAHEKWVYAWIASHCKRGEGRGGAPPSAPPPAPAATGNGAPTALTNGGGGLSGLLGDGWGAWPGREDQTPSAESPASSLPHPERDWPLLLGAGLGTYVLLDRLAAEDANGARSLVPRCMHAFVGRWATIHPLASAARVRELLPLQLLCEQASLAHKSHTHLTRISHPGLLSAAACRFATAVSLLPFPYCRFPYY